MKLDQIKEIARDRGVAVGKMNKSDSIRAIQNAEGNPSCFNTNQATQCGQTRCLWREDCK